MRNLLPTNRQQISHFAINRNNQFFPNGYVRNDDAQGSASTQPVDIYHSQTIILPSKFIIAFAIIFDRNRITMAGYQYSTSNPQSMEETKEISALFNLIDDPDSEVFSSVSDRIVSYGRGIIPNLENLWENTISEEVQLRIELLIHKLHYHDLTEDFERWKSSSYKDLLTAAMLVAKFQYPEMHSAPVLGDVEKLRRNIWLELNNYLTPLEQINVLTSILYNYYALKGNEVGYQSPDEFLINKVLETKRGNSIANGILYLLLAELLDIPVKAINIPKQFILAYIKPEYINEQHTHESSMNRIEFFIDPISGQVFTHKDVETYFKRISVPPVPSYFSPISHERIIQTLLEEFSKCFDNDKNSYKRDELMALVALLGKD